MRLRLLLAALATAALGAPSVAAADSIVFIKNGNVMRAQPDGTGAQAITGGGGWSAPSQADDGTIVAVHANHLYVIAPDGSLVAGPVPTFVTNNGGSNFRYFGPYDAEVSPDGRTVAYWYFYQQDDFYDAICGCNRQYTNKGVRFHRLDGTPHPPGTGADGEYEPSWLPNGGVLSARAEFLNGHDVGTIANGNYTQWFDVYSVPSHPQVNRGGNRLAQLIEVNGKDQLAVYTLPGAPGTGVPQDMCRFGAAQGVSFGSHSWAPTGGQLAYSDSTGIGVIDMGPTSCAVPANTLRIPGGSEPDWGPHEPGAPAGGGGTGTTPTATTPTTTTTTATTAATTTPAGQPRILASPDPARTGQRVTFNLEGGDIHERYHWTFNWSELSVTTGPGTSWDAPGQGGFYTVCTEGPMGSPPTKRKLCRELRVLAPDQQEPQQPATTTTTQGPSSTQSPSTLQPTTTQASAGTPTTTTGPPPTTGTTARPPTTSTTTTRPPTTTATTTTTTRPPTTTATTTRPPTTTTTTTTRPPTTTTRPTTTTARPPAGTVSPTRPGGTQSVGVPSSPDGQDQLGRLPVATAKAPTRLPVSSFGRRGPFTVTCAAACGWSFELRDARRRMLAVGRAKRAAGGSFKPVLGLTRTGRRSVRAGKAVRAKLTMHVAAADGRVLLRRTVPVTIPKASRRR